MPCGCCRACRLFSRDSHPDFILLEGAAGADVKIEHVRQLSEFICNSSHLGSYRVVLISRAENMTVQAANALLKSLEEPPVKCLFFLTAYFPSRLLKTIRSRCQTVKLAAPPKDQLRAWFAEETKLDLEQAEARLELYSHRPLDALQAFRSHADGDEAMDKKSFFADVEACDENPDLFLATVEKWHKQQTELIHQWLLELLSRNVEEQVRKKAEAAALDGLYRLYDKQSLRCRQSGGSLNARLRLESALSERLSLRKR